MISDRNANRIAITIVPANGRLGSVIPKTIATAAPREAPVETPIVEPSASGFFKRPCIAAPQTESDAPVRRTHSTLGSRTLRRMLVSDTTGSFSPVMTERIPSLRIRSVSFNGMLTLPRQMHRKKTARNLKLSIQNLSLCMLL